MARLIHHWTTLDPLGAAALLVLTTAIGEQPLLLVGCVVALSAAVLAAVHFVLFATYLFLACMP